ncbi:hypothetical protein NP233_g12662 [Leucocoprinus birnbaumii]|uniref:Nephrocystin 3-like N-terminal domain-containing protein n=1 Tax=Leucocoprinus birnbaumii TaxID=56174 RepID=A0AAD5VEK8_9AGAR|nr:hypothetical protein NP233_g12662 [Leucocoprinus birnbaumii]
MTLPPNLIFVANSSGPLVAALRAPNPSKPFTISFILKFFPRFRRSYSSPHNVSLEHSLSTIAIISIPSASEASKQPIQVFLPSFFHYLRDKRRAGSYVLDEGAVHLEIVTQVVCWLHPFFKIQPGLHTTKSALMWLSPATDITLDLFINNMCRFCYMAVLQLPEPHLATIQEAFGSFIPDTTWTDLVPEHVLIIWWLISPGMKDKCIDRALAQKAIPPLTERTMPEAVLDFSLLPEHRKRTRQRLCASLTAWGQDADNPQHLLWLSGPVWVGKTYVARSIAEALDAEGYPNASFFCAQWQTENLSYHPTDIFQALIYQLALQIPPYRLIFARQLNQLGFTLLGHNPSLSFEALFTNLLIAPLSHQPLNSLSHQLISHVSHCPPVIVIDGLDEPLCQREFVEMIGKHAGVSKPRWIVCSRPVLYNRNALNEATQSICHQVWMGSDDNEAHEDVQRIFNEDLAVIRAGYQPQLSDSWPPSYIRHEIIGLVSGNVGIMNLVTDYIAKSTSSNDGSVNDQFNLCLEYLNGSRNPIEDGSPFRNLCKPYTRTLDFRPNDNIIPTVTTARLIVELFTRYSDKRPTMLVQANLLGLDEATFYESLEGLRPFLSQPLPSEVNEETMLMFHPSIANFLRACTLNWLSMQDVHLAVVSHALKWLKVRHKASLGSNFGHVVRELSWVPTAASGDFIADSVDSFAFSSCWRGFSKIHHPFLSQEATQLWKDLEDFDYEMDYLKYDDSIRDFVYFIRRLFQDRILDSDFNEFAVIDSCYPGFNDLKKKGEIVIRWDDDDPYEFVQPFFPDAKPEITCYSIHLRLGKHKKTPLLLLIGDVLQRTS